MNKKQPGQFNLSKYRYWQVYITVNQEFEPSREMTLVN